MEFTAKVRTCLWFDGRGREAAEFYVSLLPDSAIEAPYRPAPDAPPLVVEFTLAGTPYMILNGGPQYPHTPTASISVPTRDQEETDRLWAALTADGGRESRCGWLVDRYGVSWQIVPEALVHTALCRRQGGRRPGAGRDDGDAEAGHRRAGSGVSRRLTREGGTRWAISRWPTSRAPSTRCSTTR